MDQKAAESVENSISYLSAMADSKMAKNSLQTSSEPQWACHMNSDMEPASEDEPDTESDSIKSTRSFPAYNIDSLIENNRRYCNDSYHMPNDEAEQTRLNVIHQIYLILLDGELTAVPITKDDPRILDIGTGPGDWTIEMSSLYPEAKIIATDIAVFDAGIAHVDIPNVSFQLDDARGEWTYHDSFDLIHIRGLSGAFQDWSSIYEQAFQHLSPGGYIQVSDADPAADTVSLANSKNSYLSIYASAMRSAAERAGYPRDLGHLHPSMLHAAGFVDIRVLEREIPIGLWPEDLQEKTLGKMVLIALLEGLEAYSLRHLTATAKWTADEVRDLCEKVQHELLSAKKMTGHIRIITGRKRTSEEVENDEKTA